MSTNDNYNKIKSVISEKFGVTDNLITPEAKLTEDLNLSYLEVADLLSLMAKEFNFQIPEDVNLENILTVSDITSIVEQYADEL